MPATLELESTLTDRYQTTVPDGVRRALNLGKRDRIRFLLQGDGTVVLQRALDKDDPALDPFLALLARDISTHPKRIRALDAGLAKRMRTLSKGVKVDLNSRLEADGE